MKQKAREATGRKSIWYNVFDKLPKYVLFLIYQHFNCKGALSLLYTNKAQYIYRSDVLSFFKVKLHLDIPKKYFSCVNLKDVVLYNTANANNATPQTPMNKTKLSTFINNFELMQHLRSLTLFGCETATNCHKLTQLTRLALVMQWAPHFQVVFPRELKILKLCPLSSIERIVCSFTPLSFGCSITTLLLNSNVLLHANQTKFFEALFPHLQVLKCSSKEYPKISNALPKTLLHLQLQSPDIYHDAIEDGPKCSTLQTLCVQTSLKLFSLSHVNNSPHLSTVYYKKCIFVPEKQDHNNNTSIKHVFCNVIRTNSYLDHISYCCFENVETMTFIFHNQSECFCTSIVSCGTECFKNQMLRFLSDFAWKTQMLKHLHRLTIYYHTRFEMSSPKSREDTVKDIITNILSPWKIEFFKKVEVVLICEKYKHPLFS